MDMAVAAGTGREVRERRAAEGGGGNAEAEADARGADARADRVQRHGGIQTEAAVDANAKGY